MSDEWKIFETTGKVTDYLTFCSHREGRQESLVGEQEVLYQKQEDTHRVGKQGDRGAWDEIPR